MSHVEFSNAISEYVGLLTGGNLDAAQKKREEIMAEFDRLHEGLATILVHAGSAIECVDEPGKGYLREICDIVDKITGEDTRDS